MCVLMVAGEGVCVRAYGGLRERVLMVVYEDVCVRAYGYRRGRLCARVW